MINKTLSEKRKELFGKLSNSVNTAYIHTEIEKQDKEFIKNLKEALCGELLKKGEGASGLDYIPQPSIMAWINKLAGDDLI